MPTNQAVLDRETPTTSTTSASPAPPRRGMSELAKTGGFLAAAAVVLLLAFITQPRAPKPVDDDLIGKKLFPSLDPLKAKRMRIVTFDDSIGRARQFEVAQVNGIWSLPSHQGYPADDRDQVANAATALVDLKPLGHVTDEIRQHALYGVVEPKPLEQQLGQGVGKLVALEDESGKRLAQLIIGKEDKTTQADEFSAPKTQLRFVRIPGQDRVYRVQMKADQFSPKFEDWIETDLLQLNPLDIAGVELRDYSVTAAMTPTGAIRPVLIPRADIKLGLDGQSGKWTLEELVEYKDKTKEEVKLADDEEVDTAKLNDLKQALDNLKIIDVARKPSQLSANLKAGQELLSDQATMQDLAAHGFRMRMAGDQVEIASNEGEAIVRLKDGVEYVLRFGEIAGVESGSDEDDDEATSPESSTANSDAEGAKAAKADGADASTTDEAKNDDVAKSEKKPGEGKSAGGLSRYIMVMAQYNPDVIEKPQLEPLPEIRKAPEAPATPPAADSAAKSDSKSAANAKAAAKSADGKSAAKSADSKGGAAKKAADEAKSAAEPEETEDLEAIELRRERIEKENARKQEEYDEKVKAAQRRAKDLNARFADWYYVVGEDTYRKTHLGKNDIIKKAADNEAKAAGADSGSADVVAPPIDPFNRFHGGQK